uniref:Uncharacterized protein n=1 Tax=Rhizophora mucronata TaxID=61149 RepID=A0A2P2IS04_RHIMU
MLAFHCLNRNPKARPLMRDIVDSLEPLQEQLSPDPGVDLSAANGKTTFTVYCE